MKPSVLLVFLICALPAIIFCQKKEMTIIMGGGISMHGTGDLTGYSLLNQVDLRIGKRFLLSPGIQFTNHFKTDVLSNDFTLNYVSSGVNIFTGIQYLVISRPHHQVAIGAGPLLRFQHSSLPESAETMLGATGEQVLILKYGKLNTVSVGYLISPTYYYHISKKLVLGAKGIIQNDTNGDVVSTAMAFVGLKF